MKYKIFKEILQYDVANGDATEDTIRTYWSSFKTFDEWCDENHLNIFSINENRAKQYRKYLIDKGYKKATITLKLHTAKSFYYGCQKMNLTNINPFIDVLSPRDTEKLNVKTKYLLKSEVQKLLKLLNENTEKEIRDKLMISLMLFEGLRVIEVKRMNVDDIDFKKKRILVKGVGSNDYIYPRKDTLILIEKYLNMRESNKSSLFINLSRNKAGGNRITRPGIRSIVNNYFKKAGIKRRGLSCHALRHTCGTQIYKQTNNIKAVQKVLRHTDINAAMKYAHIEGFSNKRVTENIDFMGGD